MFTGIIEETGVLLGKNKGAHSATFRIGCRKVLEGTRVGDSIAVNGVCLTVTELSGDGFTADVMDETVRRTTFAALSLRSRVNLERAMAADGRFGGHIVAGHVDGTGVIRSIRQEEMARVYTIAPEDPGLMRYIVEKGSITVDGISLTVADCSFGAFQVSIIPHTMQNTTLAEYRIGDKVNLETDIIGKYVEKLLLSEGASGTGKKSGGEAGSSGILGADVEGARAFLAENGY